MGNHFLNENLILERTKMLKNVFFIFVFFIFLIGCSNKNNNEVIVIDKTKSYHTEDCRRVKMAYTEQMTREEAITKNCKPCSICKPDERK
jgi:hypothetical protein